MNIDVETGGRVDVVDVTADVAAAIPDDADGVCTAFVPHTTAGVVINEHERGLCADVETALERLAPRGATYEHDRIDDNADAHLRAMVLGESVTVPIDGGELGLGTWQSILFVECDGPRRRRLRLSVVRE
ncbi:secondary thiamine-phosphate synthase enzyme YjbQ [Halovivax gelatinilyticus]|uniref:secondary thiamine-phosphate synthase enzyme YjbQ n=1 Tax=Halovivax gelatinilyticus TaxID=2961597 RepID=UPI0020CA6921|nr:secondary thiamine-phosphate synthase enzyme YjbQ [Halovivax gelatinilyticus]